ncbi:hypothetical protein MATL_G00244520 [Megalops atlanticus]|uniref:Neurotensin/neuromedin N n=1 Tax=Megalops atlanticus TaxID=7932 RepID=A0A9D3SUU8_MEGAT|nr:hypothetical protein MATL_G00244520 [Megalops atlanticus]
MHTDRGSRKMRVPIVCVVFLFLAQEGICSDADQERKAIEEELLSDLITSKVNRPQRRVSLLDACELIHSLDERGQEVWLGVGEGLVSREPFTTETLEALFNLHTLCRILQPRQSAPEYSDPLNTDSSEIAPKRKSPYILKRQLHTSKARRPYILRRSTHY